MTLNYNIPPLASKCLCLPHNAKCIQFNLNSLNSSNIVQKSSFKVSSETQRNLLAVSPRPKENYTLPMVLRKYSFSKSEEQKDSKERSVQGRTETLHGKN
jgi:hypothetical protein